MSGLWGAWSLMGAGWRLGLARGGSPERFGMLQSRQAPDGAWRVRFTSWCARFTRARQDAHQLNTSAGHRSPGWCHQVPSAHQAEPSGHQVSPVWSPRWRGWWCPWRQLVASLAGGRSSAGGQQSNHQQIGFVAGHAEPAGRWWRIHTDSAAMNGHDDLAAPAERVLAFNAPLHQVDPLGGAWVSNSGRSQLGTSPNFLTCTITAGRPHAHRSPGRGSRVFSPGARALGSRSAAISRTVRRP